MEITFSCLHLAKILIKWLPGKHEIFKQTFHILIRLVFQNDCARYMKMQFFVLCHELMLFYNPHWGLNIIVSFQIVNSIR